MRRLTGQIQTSNPAEGYVARFEREHYAWSEEAARERVGSCTSRPAFTVASNVSPRTICYGTPDRPFSCSELDPVKSSFRQRISNRSTYATAHIRHSVCYHEPAALSTSTQTFNAMAHADTRR